MIQCVLMNTRSSGQDNPCLRQCLVPGERSSRPALQSRSGTKQKLTGRWSSVFFQITSWGWMHDSPSWKTVATNAAKERLKELQEEARRMAEEAEQVSLPLIVCRRSKDCWVKICTSSWAYLNILRHRQTNPSGQGERGVRGMKVNISCPTSVRSVRTSLHACTMQVWWALVSIWWHTIV